MDNRLATRNVIGYRYITCDCKEDFEWLKSCCDFYNIEYYHRTRRNQFGLRPEYQLVYKLTVNEWYGLCKKLRARRYDSERTYDFKPRGVAF